MVSKKGGGGGENCRHILEAAACVLTTGGKGKREGYFTWAWLQGEDGGPVEKGGDRQTPPSTKRSRLEHSARFLRKVEERRRKEERGKIMIGDW